MCSRVIQCAIIIIVQRLTIKCPQSVHIVIMLVINLLTLVVCWWYNDKMIG